MTSQIKIHINGPSNFIFGKSTGNNIKSNITSVSSLLSPVFFSDWQSASLGTSSVSVGDGGKWNLLGGYGQEVTSSTGLDFPSTKVLKITANIGNNGFALNRTTGLPIPDVGVTRYYRWYVRQTFPDELVGNGDHPWQDGNAISDTNWFVGCTYGSSDAPTHSGDWQPSVWSLQTTGSTPFGAGPWLSKGVTYRFEVALERINTTQYNLAIRIYDTSNVLLYSSEDWPADFGGGTLATRIPFDFKDVTSLDGFNCGTNDFETAGNAWWTSSFLYGYQGCFAIVDKQESTSVDTWVGPYGTVMGET